MKEVSGFSLNKFTVIWFVFVVVVLFLLVSCTAITTQLTLPFNKNNPVDCSRPVMDNYLKKRCKKRVKASALMIGKSCVKSTDLQEFTCIIADVDLTFCATDNENAKKTLTNSTQDFGNNSSKRLLKQPDYNVSIALVNDGVTVDCRNRTINQHYQLGDKKYAGIRASKIRSLSDITLKNCVIRDTGFSGVELMRLFRGDELTADSQALKTGLRGHRNFELTSLHISNSKVGVYIGQASQHFLLDGISIENTLNSGIYIDADSRNIHITHAAISGSRKREGISIDSASHVVIENSVIEQNDKGAIWLYKNCGELTGMVCPIVRNTSAHDNVIRFNQISGGITVAARQGKFYMGGFCQDLQGKAGRYTDDSENNYIYENTIYCQGDEGIRLKDKGNHVFNNTIVDVGSCQFTPRVEQLMKNNKVYDNRFQKKRDN